MEVMVTIMDMALVATVMDMEIIVTIDGTSL